MMNRLRKLPFVGMLLLTALIFLLPLLFVLTGSLMGSSEFQRTYGQQNLSYPPTIPRLATLEQYIELMLNTPGFLSAYWNTLWIALSTCALQFLIGVPCAYGLAKTRLRGRRMILYLYVLMMMMPFQVTMLPMYQTIQKLDLLDSRWSLILPEAFAPLTIFLLVQSMKTIPDELLEASRLETSSRLVLLRSIVIPLCKPSILTAMILSFFETWNMVEKPLLYISSIRNEPLSMLLHEAGQQVSSTTLAGCVLYMIPVILLWANFQEEICQGVSLIQVK